MKRIRPLSAAAAVALAVSVLAPAAALAKPTITMSGSTSVAPLASLLAREYLKVCHHCVNFKLLQGGSDIGVADAAAGRVTIGNSSRDPKPSDPGGLVFTKIARDAVCIITNNGQPGPDHRPGRCAGGLRRRGAHLEQRSGASQRGTIDVAVRTPGSGTQDAFQRIFLGSTKVFGGASQKTSNGLIQQLVKSDPSAVGYVSLYFISGVHPIPYKGVPCTLRNAKSGQYGGSRNFYMVTRGRPKGAAKAWIKWITHTTAAAQIVGTDWVPLH